MNKAALIKSLDAFTKAYIVCMLWAENDESTESGGEPLDQNYSISDLSIDALKLCKKDCEAFQRDNSELLAKAGDDERNGHDFWLTRNGHGAGFWDRGYTDEVGDKLTEASKTYGTVNPYLHRKKVYLQ